ncbi:MAG: hypothetical protein IKI57_06330 [Clostridia bacterium]|nr:hypothetical protein [Clostridia bacterium]
MTFKEFLDKYLGMIIGIVLAILIIVLGGVYVVNCIALIVLLGWAGKYIQGHKSSVRTKLKGAIDQVLKDDEDDE